MAVFVMQSLGCEVAALNTVQFSKRQNPEFRGGQLAIGCGSLLRAGNHTGYRQFRGFKTSADQICEIYQGLKQSFLDDFDVMLSGYIPGAEAVEAVGKIAEDLKLRATKPGSFFWG